MGLRPDELVLEVKDRVGTIASWLIAAGLVVAAIQGIVWLWGRIFGGG